MSGASLELRVGQLQGRLGALEGQVRAMHDDVKAIRTTIDQARGGGKFLVGTWRFLVAAVTVGATLGSAVAYAATALLGG